MIQEIQKKGIQNIKKGDPERGQHKVDLATLYTGGTSMLEYKRRVLCKGCKVGSTHGGCSACERCPDETKVEQRRMGPFVVNQEVKVTSDKMCKRERHTLTLEIEPGMKEGDVLTFHGMASQSPNQLPGDVEITLKQSSSGGFKRVGRNLRYKMKITLKEALLGVHRTITHLDGHKVDVILPTHPDSDDEAPSWWKPRVIQPHQEIRIKGEGMPDGMNEDGDLLVELEIVNPEIAKLTEQQREALRNLI